MSTLNIRAVLESSDESSARVTITGGNALDLATLTALAREVIAMDTGLPASRWETVALESSTRESSHITLDLAPRPRPAGSEHHPAGTGRGI